MPLFARLVQRLTSYFSLFDTANAVPSTPLTPDDLAVPDGESSSLLRVAPPQSLVPDNLPVAHVEPSFLADERAGQGQQDEYSPSTAVFPLALPPADCVPLVRSKQRLAGHITKITLQTVAIPTLTTLSTSGEIREPVIVRVVQRDISKEQMISSVLNTVSRNEKNTSSHVPIVTVGQRKATRAVHPQLVFGTASFEYGQSDCQVFNEQVNAASVVLVMLTVNPGPTVVQHVSLQPGVGFTAYLSAPANSEVPFNYVVMSDDDFGDLP